MPVAVLITHPLDAKSARRQFGAGVEFIAHEPYGQCLQPEIPMADFFAPGDGGSADEDAVNFLTFNWHRNDRGRDLAFRDGLSPAQMISGSEWVAIGSLYREFHALKRCLATVGTLHVSCNEDPRFLAVAQKFGDAVRIYDPGHRSPSLLSSCNERILGAFPIASAKAALLRKIQFPFRGALRDKTLFLSEWTNERLAQRLPDAIVVNGRNPLRGAYLSSGDAGRSLSRYPSALDAPHDPDWLGSVLARVGARWDRPLLELISDDLRERYARNREYLARTTAIYDRLLDEYRPKQIVLPGETYEPYTIAAQLARARGVKSLLMIDGYQVTMPDFMLPVYRNENGDGKLIDRVAVYGQACWDMYKTRGLRDDQMILMRLPALDRHQELPTPGEQFDAMIMTWSPHDPNPQGLEGYRPRVLLDALQCAADAGFKRIAIKIKADHEMVWLQPFLRATGWENRVTILSGMLYEQVLKAKRVIGGMGTALAEVAYHEVPCYVFEPYENGYSDRTLRSSTVVEMACVARSKEDLGRLLRSAPQGSVTASREYLFNGPETPAL